MPRAMTTMSSDSNYGGYQGHLSLAKCGREFVRAELSVEEIAQHLLSIVKLPETNQVFVLGAVRERSESTLVPRARKGSSGHQLGGRGHMLPRRRHGSNASHVARSI